MKDSFEPWGGYASAPEANPEKWNICVADKTFPTRRWREAILYFLFGIWSGDKRFWHDPEIHFGELKLVLKTRDCRVSEKDDAFVIYGVAPDEPVNHYHGNYSLRVGGGRCEVMDALVRFAKDPYLGKLDVRIDNRHRLTFFQKERRSEYGCSVYTTK
jgi:hypothetical protein